MTKTKSTTAVKMMTAEMTADYSMIIWLVEMTDEMTAGSIELIR